MKHNQLKELGYAELFDLAAMLGLTMPGNASQAHLLNAITDHASLGCADPAAFLSKVTALLVCEDTLDLLAKDPLMEAAFDELDDDDKLDHKDFQKALGRRHARARIDEWSQRG